ncbi:FecR family protein [Novosphingobium beihaiensis]|uniref:FecR domain-containing protein n=1 Tax=Novosphingobium beihaiensis TaxID=2930389 RepID=A0ABT0BMU2_9SPHN|nr:FecR domain-containing protein [Novosphingobium beihaiensis]MCJ2186365.1 FecR domain-containing protein [Novosphingobium beihaiensis]
MASGETNRDETIREQALGWAVRTNDPGFTEWAAFTAWLEAEPAHAEAYDAVCAAVLDGADLLRSAGPANDGSPAEETRLTPAAATRRRWLGGALAASAALVLGIGFWQRERPAPFVIVTAPGETRTVKLENGTSIALSGGTRIELDHNDARRARLERGEALFTVRHDPKAPFQVAVGEDRLVDIGTVFDVRHDRHGMSVAVSEGAVQFNPEAEDVRISPGQILARAAGSNRYVLSPIAMDRIGEWREGRLTFEGASLDQVAAELTRTTGIPFSVRGAKNAGTVSGSVLIDPIRKDPGVLGSLLGLNVTPRGQGWVIGTP